MTDVGAWGPAARGGRGRRWPRFLLAALLSVGVAAAGATASVARLTLDAVTRNIERTEVAGLDPIDDGQPLHVLIVGSDAREGLTDEQRNELTLGTFDGARSDTVLLATISADRSDISLVSFPRDLLVEDPVDGGLAKLTETYLSGQEALVGAVRALGFPVNHYVEVSITGFIDTVEVVGSVEVCLEEPLVDPRAGIDLPAGCQRLEPTTALGFVRSRVGPGADFDRIERQQQFIRGMVDEILAAGMLLDPGRLVTVAEELSDNVTVDNDLSVQLMVSIAQQLRGALDDDLTMVTVPGFTRDLQDDGLEKNFVIGWSPAIDRITDQLRDGDVPPSRGTRDGREEVSVQLLTAGRSGPAGLVESTLLYGGFDVDGVAIGSEEPLGATRVHPVTGFEEHAEWVAAHLGVEVTPLPVAVDVPEDHTVVVVVGQDAVDVAEDLPDVDIT